ncbi:MAG: hypothetical protein RJB11_3491 [Planctomycetota bacterium]
MRSTRSSRSRAKQDSTSSVDDFSEIIALQDMVDDFSEIIALAPEQSQLDGQPLPGRLAAATFLTSLTVLTAKANGVNLVNLVRSQYRQCCQ